MSVETRSPGILRFATFEMDTRAGELRKKGKRIKLQEQPFQVLAVLVQRSGEVVTRDELRTQIWPQDTFVDFDNSLNTAVNKVREALGDSAESPHFVETLPRRGYRFLAAVNSIEASITPQDVRKGVRAQSRPLRLGLTVPMISFAVLVAVIVSLNVSRIRDRLAGGTAPRIQSLAVLPLTNLSADPAQEYFSDGMTDALTTDLAQLGSLRVISRTSAMRYKKTDKPLPEIARELNVDGIVEGTVQRSGDRVRITAQLIHGLSDKHLWANSYERDLRDVLALQNEVARAIAGEIKLKVTPQDQVTRSSLIPVNPQAYELYLRGLAYSRQQGGQSKRTSLDYFNRAIQIDPQWAQPYAQLARSYHWLAGFGNPELYPKGKAAALNAIRLDDGLAEAHSALAYILHNYDWDWSGAERQYHRALELNSNYSEAHYGYALLLMTAGRNNEAIAEIRKAEELDPLFPPLRADVGTVYSCAGRNEEAIEQLRNATELNPDYDVPYSALGFAYLRKGMYPEAVANVEKALSLEREDRYIGLHKVDLAYVYAVAGRKKEARKMLSELEQQEANGRNLGSLGLYPFYFALGEKDRALAWMDKAYNEKSEALLYLRCWPEFDRLLADPRFAKLVRRVGIPQ
jgi:TolB-like protein/DNA-binding winged helix-turn-helix (wHTH) protein/tetratricopeptide (TPR) repeat protein